jgi:hypothetical protein
MRNYRNDIENILLCNGCTISSTGTHDEDFDIFLNKRGKGFAVAKVIRTGKAANEVLAKAEIHGKGFQ